ncbi:hypothetical protein Tco_0994719 [Tanacetum coccineum]
MIEELGLSVSRRSREHWLVKTGQLSLKGDTFYVSTQCHTQMSMWIISRGVVLLILLMEYKFQVWYIELTSPSDHDNSRQNTRLSKPNLKSSSMGHLSKTLILPSVSDSCFISSSVSEVKRGNDSFCISRFVLMTETSRVYDGEVVYTTLLSMVMKYSAYVRRIVADFSHAPPNEYSPSPNDKKQSFNSAKIGRCWFGGKLIQKLRQKGVYEESFSRHAA